MKIATLRYCLELLEKRKQDVWPDAPYRRLDSSVYEQYSIEYNKCIQGIAEINAAIDNTEVTLNTITKP